MIKSKTWVKDRYFEYQKGDLIKLVRKKKNGHPRALEFGKTYEVYKTENDDLFVTAIIQDSFTYIKVNKNYFVPVEKIRDEIIKDILSND